MPHVTSIGEWRWIIASEHGPGKAGTRHVLHVMALLMNDGSGCDAGLRRLAVMTGLSREVVGEHRDRAAIDGWLIPPPGFGAPEWSEVRHQRGLVWLPAAPETVLQVVEKVRQSKAERVAEKVRQLSKRQQRGKSDSSGQESQPVVAEKVDHNSSSLHLSPRAQALRKWYDETEVDRDIRVERTPGQLRFRGYHEFIQRWNAEAP